MGGWSRSLLQRTPIRESVAAAGIFQGEKKEGGGQAACNDSMKGLYDNADDMGTGMDITGSNDCCTRMCTESGTMVNFHSQLQASWAAFVGEYIFDIEVSNKM